MRTRKKIQFVFADSKTFVEQDYRILRSKYRVDRFRFVMSKNPLVFAFQFLKQLISLLLWGWTYDIFYIWFADYHSFLPTIFARLTGKKSVVVIGGYDVCRIPSLKYGAFYKSYRGFFTIQSIRNSSLNLAVSKYVDRKVKFIAPKARHELIYNCIEFAEKPTQSMGKENLIITVGSITNEQTFFRKGIDTFIEVATALPQYPFMVIGIDVAALGHLLDHIPANLTLVGRTMHDELISYYQRAKIYCQFSRMDTFCLTIAEAMYFNCTPIITNEGGMPEVVGKYGKIVPRKVSIVSEEILALTESGAIQPGIEGWVVSNFSFDARKEKLLDSLNKLSVIQM